MGNNLLLSKLGMITHMERVSLHLHCTQNGNESKALHCTTEPKQSALVSHRTRCWTCPCRSLWAETRGTESPLRDPDTWSLFTVGAAMAVVRKAHGRLQHTTRHFQKKTFPEHYLSSLRTPVRRCLANSAHNHSDSKAAEKFQKRKVLGSPLARFWLTLHQRLTACSGSKATDHKPVLRVLTDTKRRAKRLRFICCSCPLPLLVI